MTEGETHIPGAVLGAAVAVIQALLLQARGLFLPAPQRQKLGARVHVRAPLQRLGARTTAA